MKRLLVMMLMAMSLAAVAPAITASPAFAADVKCNPTEPMPAPWWWGNQYAFERAGSAVVLAVNPPYIIGNDAYLWGLNGEDRQKWIHDCIGYDSVAGRNNWQLRYAYNPILCLQAVGVGYAELNSCNSSTAQIWHRVPVGAYTQLRNYGYRECLDTQGDGYSNYTVVDLNTCNSSNRRQLWY